MCISTCSIKKQVSTEINTYKYIYIYKQTNIQCIYTYYSMFFKVNQHTFTHGLTFHPPISSPAPIHSNSCGLFIFRACSTPLGEEPSYRGDEAKDLQLCRGLGCGPIVERYDYYSIYKYICIHITVGIYIQKYKNEL